MKTSRIFATAAAVALLATSMGACGSAKNAENKAKGNQVNVVATTTQICDYVTQIASTADAKSGLSLNKTDSQGKKSVIGAPQDKAKSTINLTCLLAPNASAHEHEMTPAQSKALSKADLMLVSGVDLEHFLDQAVKATKSRIQRLRLLRKRIFHTRLIAVSLRCMLKSGHSLQKKARRSLNSSTIHIFGPARRTR